MSIIIGGDLVPCGESESFFEMGDIKNILGDELLKIWNDADFRFFNLECPITRSNERILKYGPNIKCTPKSISGIKKLMPTCVMLANNHIMDYSISGIKETLKNLDENNINWIGVGKNIDDVKDVFEFRYQDKTVSIYNCCEHEFSIASRESYGANPYSDDTLDRIKEIKKKSDYVLVIYHGGKEHYRYPSPQLQKRCRKMIEVGAGLVVCQHSHCIGCEEKYKDGLIVYGQGNFVFNAQQNEFWNTSLLIDIDVLDKIEIRYIPIIQTERGTRMANPEEAEKILKEYEGRSEQIKNMNFVYDEYQKFATEKLNNYILTLYNNPILLRIIKKLFPGVFSKIKFNYAGILNIVECEAHSELFAEGIKNKIYPKGNKK